MASFTFRMEACHNIPKLQHLVKTQPKNCPFQLCLWSTAQLQQQHPALLLPRGFLALYILQQWEPGYSLSARIALRKCCLVRTFDWLLPALPRVSSPASSLCCTSSHLKLAEVPLTFFGRPREQLIPHYLATRYVIAGLFPSTFLPWVSLFTSQLVELLLQILPSQL